MARLKAAIRFALVALAWFWSAQAMACVVNDPTTTPDFGNYSPAAVKAGMVPIGTVSGGINCTGTVLALLGGNTLTGALGSANGFRMTPVNGGEPVTFKVYLDQAGTKAMSTTATTNFLDPQVIDVLNLFGSSPSNIPFYVKPSSVNPVVAGAYTGTFTIAWVWKICSGGTWVSGACTLGTLKQGAATATIRFTLTVAARPVTIAISSVSTWDPVSLTTNPRALPSGKRRTTVTITNTDIVATDAAGVVVDVPTAANTVIALDGDGTGSPVVQTTANSSGLTLAYNGPGATDDNVEFSTDNGTTFAYQPAANDSVSQAAVTTVRFRPQGSMAAGSTFAISVPYTVK